jgi:CRP/FNR family transcriptional regulator, cyclic AMP receptor protein
VTRDQWVRTGVRWEHRPTGRGGRAIVKAGIAEREEALAGAPLFAGLSRRQLRDLARTSGVATYPEGTLIVKEGTPGTVLYVILEGAVRVVRKGRTVGRLGSGNFFGEMSVLDGSPRTADVIAEAPSLLLSLSQTSLRAALRSDGRLALRIMEAMASRLRQLERPLVG